MSENQDKEEARRTIWASLPNIMKSPVWMDYIGLSISSTFEHFSKQ